MNPSDLPERFAAKIEVAPNGCWLWTGAQQGEGYGSFSVEGKIVLAHRFAYEAIVGEIPAGKMIDHVRERGCRHRCCVNPAHMEVVTNRENVLRGDHPHVIAHLDGRCTRGHPAEFYRRKSGPRKGEVAYCLACRRDGKVAA